MTDLPRGVTTLLNKAADPWTYRVRHVTTEAEFGGLSEDEDGDGKRHRVTTTETVDSIGVRFDHPDGRAAVAVWVRRAGWVCTGKLGVRWWKTTTARKRARPPLLVLADPAAVALVSVLLRWSRRSYAFTVGVRGRHEAEYTPVELDATQLGAYVAGCGAGEGT